MSFNNPGTVTRQRSENVFAFPDDYTIIDIETTGLSCDYDEIIELSAIRIRNRQISDKFTSLIKPLQPISDFIENLTGISNAMVEDAPYIEDVLGQYIEFLGTDYIVGHNVSFDIRFISHAKENLYGECLHNDHIDTLRLSRLIIKDIENYRLGTLAKHFDIEQTSAHRAEVDCLTTYALFEKLRVLNTEKEDTFVNQFKDKGNILNGARIVFKGLTRLCSFDGYSRICEMTGGVADTVFYTDKTDFIVFGKNTYSKYMRGDYSEKMEKALKLSRAGKLKILSETQFAKMLGIDVPQMHFTSYPQHIDIKSMQANTEDFDENHPLFGKVCVFTGTLEKMPRREAMQRVLDAGGQIGANVTSKTNFLILGNNDYCQAIKDGKSNKHKKAEALKLKGQDIEIIPENVFYDMIDEN